MPLHGRPAWPQLTFLMALILVVAPVSTVLSESDSSQVALDSVSNNVQRLVELTYPDPALRVVADAIFDQLAISFPTIDSKTLQEVREQFDLSALRERLVTAYTANLSQEDAAALMEFYQSPLGVRTRVAQTKAWTMVWIEGQETGRRMIEKALAGKEMPVVQWSEFIPDDSTFRVQLPGEPSEMTIPTGTPSGVVDARQYMTTSPYCAYMVRYADSAAGDSVDIGAMLQGAADTVINRVGGELVSELPVLCGGKPGRELIIMLADGDGIYRVRLLADGHRLYQLTAVTPISEYYTSQAVHFLDSFELMRQ